MREICLYFWAKNFEVRYVLGVTETGLSQSYLRCFPTIFSVQKKQQQLFAMFFEKPLSEIRSFK